MAGGFIANGLYEKSREYKDTIAAAAEQKYYSKFDEKANGLVVLLIDNELTHHGKKMIAGTEVHYGYIRCRKDLLRYKGLPITDYNIVGYLAPDLEREVKQLVRPRR